MYGTALNVMEQTVQHIRLVIEWVALSIEALAAIMIIAAILKLLITQGTFRYLFHLGEPGAHIEYKQLLGRPLLLSLDLLVAADVIMTVALPTTMENVLSLGMLALIRTFLSWSLIVEMDERWPWQPPKDH